MTPSEPPALRVLDNALIKEFESVFMVLFKDHATKESFDIWIKALKLLDEIKESE